MRAAKAKLAAAMRTATLGHPERFLVEGFSLEGLGVQGLGFWFRV